MLGPWFYSGMEVRLFIFETIRIFENCSTNCPTHFYFIFSHECKKSSSTPTTALVVFLMATENGKNVRYYVSSFCFKSRNIELADQIVAREIQLREQMRIASITQQRRVLELAQQRRQEILNEIEGNSPTLILKTKRFCKASHNNNASNKQTTSNKKNSAVNEINSDEHCKDDIMKTPEKTQFIEENVATPDTLPMTPSTETEGGSNNNSSYIYNNDDEDEDVTCTICIGVINDGDKVGVLPCNHLFHSSCLKEWIKRRNVCPLCQEPNIATPQNQQERRNSATQSRMLATTGIHYPESDDDNEEINHNRPVHSIAVRRASNVESRGSLRINTNLDASYNSPIPPSIPRASYGGNSVNRRVQRLTLNESGEVEFTAVARSSRRRDPRVIRGRGIALAIDHRNRYRRSQRNYRRRGTNH